MSDEFKAGRQAYQDGKPWESARSEEWRQGWRRAQEEFGPERRRQEREIDALKRREKNP